MKQLVKMASIEASKNLHDCIEILSISDNLNDLMMYISAKEKGKSCEVPKGEALVLIKMSIEKLGKLEDSLKKANDWITAIKDS